MLPRALRHGQRLVGAVGHGGMRDPLPWHRLPAQGRVLALACAALAPPAAPVGRVAPAQQLPTRGACGRWRWFLSFAHDATSAFLAQRPAEGQSAKWLLRI